jgi:hypothetical protein
MSRNGFNECEREYNRREEAVEMAKDQRSETVDTGERQDAVMGKQMTDIAALRELHRKALDGDVAYQEQFIADAASLLDEVDLLRDARLSLDPFEFPELCQRIDAALGEKKK